MPFQGHGAATVKAEEMLFQKKRKPQNSTDLLDNWH
jgi:hypothetical protein